MSLNSACCVFIVAFKKNTAIPDLLVRKLNDKTLIERSIDLALSIVSKSDIRILTDSFEICEVATSQSIKFNHFDNIDLLWEKMDTNAIKDYEYYLFLDPTAPLLRKRHIVKSMNKLDSEGFDLIIPSYYEKRLNAINEKESINSQALLSGLTYRNPTLNYSSSFILFNKHFLANKEFHNPGTIDLGNQHVSINSYQDWWICEKILKRKRIVINVVGGGNIGTGHIFRCITLAHEINDHEIIFVTHETNSFVVSHIAAKEYPIHVYETEDRLIELLRELKPDLLMVDILDTTLPFMKRLKSLNHFKTINFEDLGDGSQFADITINDLYEEPKNGYSNTFWGSKYFVLRDEFFNVDRNSFNQEVRRLFISFGGSDPSGYAIEVLKCLKELIIQSNLSINIIIGPNFSRREEFNSLIADDFSNVDIEVFDSVFLVSQVMKDCDVAISSNGRTTYELAHMRIPTLIIPHHEREDGHDFAKIESGFVKINYKDASNYNIIESEFRRLVENSSFRKVLFDNMDRLDFRDSKQNVMSLINSLL